jgi:hypothetical protein
MAGGATATIQVVARNYDGGAIVTASAGVTSSQSELTPADNHVQVLTSVQSVPVILIVTNTNSDGPGSLRQAISYANLNDATDTIDFNIPGPGPHVIAPEAAIDAITSPVVIDGRTQPSYFAGGRVVLDGRNIPAPTVVAGLNIAGGTPAASGAGSTIRGLAFVNWPGVGVRVQAAGTATTILTDNYVGIDPAGLIAAPNAAGIAVDFGTAIIGQSFAGGGPNEIAYNTFAGIRVLNTASAYVEINSIHDNGGLGIDLNSDGVTANDAGDGDAGPSGRQNFPVLTTATSDGAVTTVDGTLNSTPNTLMRLQFFASSSCHSSGYGEGRRFIGGVNDMTDASGNLSLSFLAFQGTVGEFITATATGTTGTSEFSACRAVTEP